MFSTLYQDSSPALCVHCQIDQSANGEMWKIFSLHAQLYLNWQALTYQWYEGVEALSQDPGQPDSVLCRSGPIAELTSDTLQKTFKKFWPDAAITEILQRLAKQAL